VFSKQADLESQRTERAAAAAAKGPSAGSGSGGPAAMHAYSMEEYGLDRAAMQERLDWYYKEYL
jgi:hypothetical protein